MTIRATANIVRIYLFIMYCSLIPQTKIANLINKNSGQKAHASDRKVLSIQLLKYFIPCISFNGLFLFKEEEDEVDKLTYTPRNRGDGQ